MTRHLTAAALATAALLAACASSPTVTPQLAAARDAVRSAETNSQVLDAAPLELKQATEAMTKANRLSAEGESIADVNTAAYIAQRRAEAAVAVAAAKAKEDAIKDAQADRERVRADVKTEQARLAQAQAVNAQLSANAAQMQSDAAQRQAAAARAQAAQAQIESAQLRQQLDALAAQQTDRGMLVTLGDVLFEFGRAEIKPGAMDAMARLATYLQEHPERQVLIEGHTDSVGSDAANQLLSQRRAENVAIQLERLGVSPNRVIARGYGESFPIADNNTDTNRALNRRVEIYISDDSQPVRARG